MVLIKDSKKLKDLCKLIAKDKFITVDTEFIRDRYYYPKLCLMQIASQEYCFAIDTLEKDIDISPILKIFNNKKIVKVFHACRQDIEIILNLNGKMPRPIFDTQVAAMVCGFGATSSYCLLYTSDAADES